MKLRLDERKFLYDEWIVTNGLGGYACGSVTGIPMRKYHSLLMASLNAPFGRTSLLNYVEDQIILPDNRRIDLSQLRTKNKIDPEPYNIEVMIKPNFAIWTYTFDHIKLDKRIWMAHGQNTVYIRYHLIAGSEPISIKWRPFFHFRSAEESVSKNPDFIYEIHAMERGYEIKQNPFPTLRLHNEKHPPFTLDHQKKEDVYYELEERRGYDCYGSLTSPGFFQHTLSPHDKTTFIASTEEWDILEAMHTEEALVAEWQRQKGILKAAKSQNYSPNLSELFLSADQFVITPIGREKDAIRLKAIGEEARSIIAGYPWFTDWGRDTMISLEGLTLTTGRHHIAHAILRTFAYYIRDGLIPNMFPDGQNEGLYHTADATLWFFHAVDRYLSFTHDEDFLEYMIPRFQQIIDHHVKGTKFGIKVDDDGLLSQGQEGYQLTWMDAKVGDWVVTPRRGKTVEINALWYNALKLMELWTGKTSEIAQKCFESFNREFWYEEEGYLYDLIGLYNKKDSALRPNQIFALSLRFPVLKEERWKEVVDTVKKELLTTYGLRTLSRSHSDFKAYYEGNVWARDAAYHQGTVWPWLIGHFIDAWLKVYPERDEEAKSFLDGIERHTASECIGSIGEIFDAADPYHARGCFAQAWSVAEFIRAYAKLYG